jgi:hypothetical protein
MPKIANPKAEYDDKAEELELDEERILANKKKKFIIKMKMKKKLQQEKEEEAKGIQYNETAVPEIKFEAKNPKVKQK